MNRSKRLWWRRLIDYVGTLLLSIILGLIVWLIAINQENPLVTQAYPARVNLQLRGIDDALGPTRDLTRESVQVVLQGPQTAWEALPAGAVTAYVDLTGLGQGTHIAPIQATVSDPQFIVKSLEPAELQVRLDTVITKSVPVRVSIMDNAAFGYDVQAPVLNPESVTVSGPAAQVNLVAAADTQIVLRGAKSQVERFETVELVDGQNQPVSMVTALPPVVEIVVPVERWPGRKEVAVRVDLEGQPAEGFRLGPLVVEPDTVVLRGNADALSTLGLVETEPVSVAGATSDLRAQPKLILPEGVTAFEGAVVDVLVGIVPVEVSDRITLKPTLRGVESGLQANVALDTMDVIVSGPQSILAALEPDDVFVLLMMNGRLAGSHVITPNVVIPDGVRLEGVLPATVEVILTEPLTPTSTLPITTTQTPTATLLIPVATPPNDEDDAAE